MDRRHKQWSKQLLLSSFASKNVLLRVTMFMKWLPKVTLILFDTSSLAFICFQFYVKIFFIGYVSYVRSYAALPKDVRDVFNFQSLHLGHYAKSFALRDPPAQINTAGRMGQRNDRIQPFNTARQRNPALLKRAASLALG